SWTKHIKHPSELFKKGQKVEAVVLKIDKEKERLSLGYKQLLRDPWDEEIPQRYKVGASTTGKVSKITDFGVFVEIEGGVEGLIHISETALEPSMRLEDKFKPQDEITAKIIKADREERKIALSLREHRMDSERKQMEDYHTAQGTVDQSLGRAAKKTKKRPDTDSDSDE
ncbi:MAG: S1 RNA-binding domain-containing protein, partial [Nitrospiraceae bacterium]